jgi:hypothetical protein
MPEIGVGQYRWIGGQAGEGQTAAAYIRFVLFRRQEADAVPGVEQGQGHGHEGEKVAGRTDGDDDEVGSVDACCW